MATKPETKPEDSTETKATQKLQGKGGVFYLVNPAGAIHDVTRQHARVRLQQVGWRKATESEIRKLLDNKIGMKVKDGEGNVSLHAIQTFDEPLCEPWSPDPEGDLEP